MPSIAFGLALSQRFYTWSEWRTLFLSRTDDVKPQYADDSSKYSIYFYDGPEVHICEIWKIAVPYPMAAQQAANDADRVEFETFYKSLCNRPNISKIEITSVAATAVVSSTDAAPPTFFALFDRVIPAENKYVATLFNSSTVKNIIIQRIRVYNWQVLIVTGILLEQQLERISARTAGTAINISAYDSNDTLPTGISADVGSTAVTTSYVVERIFTTNDEMALTANNIATWRVELAGSVIYDRKPGTKGHVLRTGQGIAVKNITRSIVGSVSYIIDFTVEGL